MALRGISSSRIHERIECIVSGNDALCETLVAMSDKAWTVVISAYLVLQVLEKRVRVDHVGEREQRGSYVK